MRMLAHVLRRKGPVQQKDEPLRTAIWESRRASQEVKALRERRSWLRSLLVGAAGEGHLVARRALESDFAVALEELRHAETRLARCEEYVEWLLENAPTATADSPGQRRVRTTLDLASCLVAPSVAEEFFGFTEDYLERKIAEGWGPLRVSFCLVTTIALGIWHSFTGKLLGFQRRLPPGD